MARELLLPAHLAMLSWCMSYSTAADLAGAVRLQKKAPKREPKAGRGGRAGRGRGRATAVEAAGGAAPDKAWQTARLSRSGVPLAKQLKVLPGVMHSRVSL